MPDEKSSGTQNTIKKPRRRKWLIISGAILALIVLLVMVAPSLLCTGPGVRLIVGQINSRIPGKIKIGSLSLGWLSPLSMTHVTLTDPEGTAVIKNASIRTQLSLLGLITNFHQLGKIDIPISAVHLATVNGKLNLLQAISAATAAKAPAAAVPSAAPPPAAPAKAPPGAVSPIPALAGEIDLTVKRLTWVTAGKPPLHATNLHFSSAFNTRSIKPITAALSVAVGLGAAAPARISLNIQASAFDSAGLLPWRKISGTVDVKTHGLALACLNPLLAQSGMHLSASGILSLDTRVDAKLNSAASLQLSLRADQLRLSGPMFKGDKPDLGTVAINTIASLNFGGKSPHYLLKTCSLTSSNLGSISLTGAGSIQTLQAIIHHEYLRPPGKAEFALSLQSTLSRVLDQFPHLFRSPSGAKFTGGAMALSVRVDAADGPGSSPVPDSSSSSTILPPVSFKLHSRLSTLRWTLPSHQHTRSAHGDLALSGATTGGPVSVALSAFVGGGAAKPSTVELRGTVSPFGHQRLKALPAMTGHLALDISHFYLSYLKRFNLPVDTQGVLHGHLAVASNAPQQGRINGQMQIDALTLGGAALHGDHPVLGNLLIPIDMVWDARHLNVEQIAMQSPVLNISVSGAVNLNRISSLKSMAGDWGHTSLMVKSSVNTALFADDFRHTLHLNRLPLRIKTGTTDVQVNLTSRNTTSVLTLNLRVSPQKCRWKQSPALIDPLVLRGTAMRNAGRWILQQCRVSQSNPKSAAAIWKLSLRTARPARHLSYLLTGDWNLGRLQQESAPFIQWDGRSVGGLVSLSGDLNNILTPAPGAKVKLSLQHLMYRPDGKTAPVQIASVTVPLKADWAIHKGTVQSAEISLAVKSPQWLDLAAAADVTPKPFSIEHLRLNLAAVDIGRLWTLARSLKPSLPAYQIAGYIKKSPIHLSVLPGRLRVTDAALHLTSLSLHGMVKNTPAFTEPDLNLLMAADVHTGKTRSINLSNLSLQTADGLVTVAVVKPVIVRLAGATPQIAAPSIKIAADLARLQNLLICLGKLPTGTKLAGHLALNASALGSSKVITTSLDSQITGYQMVMPGQTKVLPPTNLLATLVGRADLSRKIFTATHTCRIGTPAAAGGNLLTLSRDSVLAWGLGGAESIHGSLQYDLAAAIALLKPFLPPTLSASGTGTMPLAINGPLTSAPGLLIARKLTIAPTALAIKQLSYDGTVLGPGSIGFSESAGHIVITSSSIPANQGTLNLGGYIDLNGDNPTYVLPAPLQLADNVHINAPMGASILKFLPLTWGNKGQPALLNVQGVLNMSLKSADLPLASAAMKKTGTAVGTVSVTHLTTNAPFVSQISVLSGPLGGNINIADSGIRPTQFVLKNGRVSYKDMKMVLASFGLDLGGWVSLNNQMNVDLSITGGGLTLPIPLKLSGSTASPQIKLTSHPLKSIGKGIKGQVKGLLHGLFGQ